MSKIFYFCTKTAMNKTAWTVVLALLFIACGSPETEKNEEKDLIKGLLTFTESGMTFLDCTQSERYRVLDIDHSIHEAMLDLPLRTDDPFYAELKGKIGPVESQLQLDQLLGQKIEVSEVIQLSADIPALCDHQIMPVHQFSNLEERWFVEINYFVPAVVYHYPRMGYKFYFPFESEDFPALENGDVHNWELHGHDKQLQLSILRQDCLEETDGSLYSHRMIFNLDGEEKTACGGMEVEPES